MYIKTTYSVDESQKYFWKRQNYRDRKYLSGCQVLGVGRDFVLKGSRGILWHDGNCPIS